MKRWTKILNTLVQFLSKFIFKGILPLNYYDTPLHQEAHFFKGENLSYMPHNLRGANSRKILVAQEKGTFAASH